MEIIDIHAHIYKKIAGITKGAPMTSESLGRVKIGNEIRQFLPPIFEETNSKVDTLIAYMDWCGISKALLMPNPYYGYNNDYFLEAIEKYPTRLKAVALVDFIKGKKAAEELEMIYEQTPLFGFKIETNSTFQCAPEKHMSDAEFAPIWECCNSHKQPVFIHMFTDQDVKDAKILVNKYRDINFIFCHMGADSCFRPTVNPNNFDELLSIVRENKNAYLDTSTVPEYFDEEYPYPSAMKIIEKAYKTVGAEKLMWASDYPGMLNKATMQELINMVMKHCDIPQNDMELIMGKNAKKMFF